MPEGSPNRFATGKQACCLTAESPGHSPIKLRNSSTRLTGPLGSERPDARTSPAAMLRGRLRNRRLKPTLQFSSATGNGPPAEPSGREPTHDDSGSDHTLWLGPVRPLAVHVAPAAPRGRHRLH